MSDTDDFIEAGVVAVESTRTGPVHLYFPVEVEVLPSTGGAPADDARALEELTDSLDSE